MKKKILIFRFGAPVPTKGDFVAVVEKLSLDIESGAAMGCTIPNGMATLILTDKTVAEVKQAFMEAAAEIEDDLPIIVLDEEGMKGIDLKVMGFEDFERMNRVFDREHDIAPKEGVQCTLSLDELLDLVNTVGVNGLDEAQMKRLKELSEQ
jgi:hypothetical protein